MLEEILENMQMNVRKSNFNSISVRLKLYRTVLSTVRRM